MTTNSLHRTAPARRTATERARVIDLLVRDFDAALERSPAAGRRRFAELLGQLDLPHLRRLLAVVLVDPTQRLPDPEC